MCWLLHAEQPFDGGGNAPTAACILCATCCLQDEVVSRLKDVVDDFKELLPLVEELGNPALQVSCGPSGSTASGSMYAGIHGLDQAAGCGRQGDACGNPQMTEEIEA